MYCYNGWMSVLSRGQFGNPLDYFDRTWAEMQKPFGTGDNEHWIGLDNLYELSNAKNYVVKFELKGASGGPYHEVFYHDFQLLDNVDYPMHMSGYNSTLSTVPDNWGMNQNGMKFSTKDVDNDNNGGNCAVTYPGPNW